MNAEKCIVLPILRERAGDTAEIWRLIGGTNAPFAQLRKGITMGWSTKPTPKEKGLRCLVTLNGIFGPQVRQAKVVEWPIGVYRWSVLPEGGYNENIVAWMRQPKPYNP